MQIVLPSSAQAADVKAAYSERTNYMVLDVSACMSGQQLREMPRPDMAALKAAGDALPSMTSVAIATWSGESHAYHIPAHASADRPEPLA